MVLAYLVTNELNGNTYVGITGQTVVARWKRHLYNAKTGVKTYLYSAIRKYGPENFSVAPIVSCLNADTAVLVERDLILDRKPAYNQTNGGEFTVGKRVSREVVEKIRAANTGKKRTPEQNAAMSVAKKKQFAERPELREQMAQHLAAVRGHIDHDKRIAAVKKHHETYTWSAESRAKLSKSCMGRSYGKDIIDRMAQKKKKPVLCTTLGKVFPSVLEAAAATGIQFSGISRVARGKQKQAGGMKFQFA